MAGAAGGGALPGVLTPGAAAFRHSPDAGGRRPGSRRPAGRPDPKRTRQSRHQPRWPSCAPPGGPAGTVTQRSTGGAEGGHGVRRGSTGMRGGHPCQARLYGRAPVAVQPHPPCTQHRPTVRRRLEARPGQLGASHCSNMHTQPSRQTVASTSAGNVAASTGAPRCPRVERWEKGKKCGSAPAGPAPGPQPLPPRPAG